jgi:hypothetical protein
MVKTFEVYAYLDPRYPDSYKYGDKDFKTPISMRKCKKNIVVLGAVKRKPTEEEYLQLISLF